jgi:hypothetical protein
MTAAQRLRKWAEQSSDRAAGMEYKIQPTGGGIWAVTAAVDNSSVSIKVEAKWAGDLEKGAADTIALLEAAGETVPG